MSSRISGRFKPSVYFLACGMVLGGMAAPLAAAEKQPAGAPSTEEFFIISSVDIKKNQLVLKRPTEVTVLMDVTDKTGCVDEKGKTVRLKDLRAGDTVFVTFRRRADGELEAGRIRMGYMTLEEVHRRYMRSSNE